MRAQLSISHRQDLVDALRQTFGAHDPEALRTSALAEKSPSSAASISYAAFGQGFRVMAWVTPGQLFLYLESSEGRLRKATNGAWQLILRNAKAHHPKLDSLVLLDEDSNDEIAQAGVGFEENLKRVEIVAPLAIGAATIAVLVVAIAGFGGSWDLAVGSIPAFVAAILALLWLLVDIRKKRLVWS